MAALLATSAAPIEAAETAAPPVSTALSPAETAPLSTTTDPNPADKPGPGTAMPSPEKALGPRGPAGDAPAGAMAAPARQTLVPQKGDSGDVEEVVLLARPAAILQGSTTWETAVAHLKDSFRTIEAAPAGPVAEVSGVRFGTTPSGKALRYKHTGSYDEISGTYDTLIAYFDAKDIAVQDRFMEEYVTDLTDGADDRLDVNIYALLK